MSRLLEVEDLRVSFHSYAGEVKAVCGISFGVEKGETLALVGESGCGKSVTAKALMRLFDRTSGEIMPGSKITFDGQDVLALSRKELYAFRGAQIGMIFQDPMTSLDPTMTVGKQVGESLMIHKGISMREAEKEAIDLLRDLKKRLGTAIILVTHDLGIVADFADRIQVMYAGQIVEEGTKEEIFRSCEHPYTWALLRSIPQEGASGTELYSLHGTPPDLLLPLTGCPFASRCEYCMGICKQCAPEKTQLSDTHAVSCWLKHPKAPKVKNPVEIGGKSCG